MINRGRHLLNIETIINGKLATNTYLLWCERTKQGLIIDPAENVQEILGRITHSQVSVKYIINTHGHADHIAGNKEIANTLNIPIGIGVEDADMLHDTNDNFAQYLGIRGEQPAASLILADHDKLVMGDYEFLIIKTPGHTPGGISLYCEIAQVLFCGDTLFRRSMGRVDLPGGSMEQILYSLAKLCQLPEDTVVYPGHGRSTTIAFEKENNPYCQRIGEN